MTANTAQRVAVQKWVSTSSHGGSMVAVVTNAPERTYVKWTDYAALETKLAAQAAEIERLRGFAQDVMESWPEGDVDGGYLQEAAESRGLLRVVTLAGSCGEDCSCNEFYLEGEARECYRKTSLLTGKPESDTRIAAFLAANGGGRED